METLIIYLLKVSLSIALFYGLHMLFFRNETFLKLRRVYFLFALVFSLLFPFLDFYWEVSQESELPLPAYLMSEIEIFVGGQRESFSIADIANGISMSTFLILVGALGALFLLVRFAVQLISLFAKLMQLESEEVNGFKVIVVDDTSLPSFSFFRWIVINTANAQETQIFDIVCHEEEHSKQLHSIDVIFFEIFCILFWWNPFAWLLKNETKLNLEYLADEGVLKNKNDIKEYQYTLLQISTANTGMAFINNFNVSHLKKRITMMNKKRTSNVWSGKYLLALPLALALILGNVAYAAPDMMNSENLETPTLQNPVKRSSESSQVFTVVEQMPKFVGGESEMMKNIANNLRYPVTAQEAGAQGRVVVRFIITETGDITDAEIIKNGTTLGNQQAEIVVVAYKDKDQEKEEKTLTLDEINKLIEREAIRAVYLMPKWEPGKQNGKEVPVYFTLPILFRLK